MAPGRSLPVPHLTLPSSPNPESQSPIPPQADGGDLRCRTIRRCRREGFSVFPATEPGATDGACGTEVLQNCRNNAALSPVGRE
ncbi:hypothetical protein ACP4OV_017295 [Aristida adscensionis]